MLFPKLKKVKQKTFIQNEFRGLDTNLFPDKFGFIDMKNLSADNFPIFSPRKSRKVLTTLEKPNNMISGTNGLAGCADGLLVFTKKSGDKNAVLNISGRGAPSLEINLVREDVKWKLLDAPPEYKKDIFSSAIHDFMLEQKEFRGTASELCELLRQKYSKYEFQNNWIYRDLLQHDDEIRSLGIDYGKTKSNGIRSIYVSYDEQRDTSGGIILCAEVVDPAVPDECANVDISSNTVDVDESNITTLTVPADGNDFIAMMAENLRKQLASQGINVKPFNATE